MTACAFIKRARSRKPVLISILAFPVVFHAATPESSSFRENPTYLSTYTWHWIRGILCEAIDGSWSEMLSNRQTGRQTHTTTTVTLAAHACRGLIAEHVRCPLPLSYLHPRGWSHAGASITNTSIQCSALVVPHTHTYWENFVFQKSSSLDLTLQKR